MFKKMTLAMFLVNSLVFAEAIIKPKDNSLDSNVLIEKKEVVNKENILEYEKILKRLQEKKDYEDKIKLEKEKIIQESNSNKPKESINFNVIGVIKVQNKNYAYLLTKDNKILKANVGMDFEGNKIVSIDNYGVNIENDSHKTYLPITTSQVNESDVIFHSANPNRNNIQMPR